MIYDGRIQGTWSSHPEGMGWDGNDGEVREADPTARAQHAKSPPSSSGHTTHAADTASSPVLAIAVSSERWRVGRDGRGVMPGVMTTTRMTSPELVG